MHDFLEKTFRLSESHTKIRTEILAGVTTFMTMSYIIFVQPAVLSTTGMDFQAVLASTCIVSAIGCFLMALLANYPIAVAPAMGHAFSLLSLSWRPCTTHGSLLWVPYSSQALLFC